MRPSKDQPFYHLFAENAETEYIAYVSEQNLLPDTSGKPVRHPQIAEVFERDEDGSYKAAQHPAELTCSDAAAAAAVRFCRDPLLLRSCDFFCCSSNTFGSVGGPS